MRSLFKKEASSDKKTIRFGLRSLFVLFVLLAIPLAILQRFRSHSSQTQGFLDNATSACSGLRYYFENENSKNESSKNSHWWHDAKYVGVPPGPKWGKKCLGNYAFVKIEALELRKFVGKSLSEYLDFDDVRFVKRLAIIGAPNLTSLEGISGLPNLQSLTIVDAPKLHSLNEMHTVPKLTHLFVWGCGELSEVDGVGKLADLERLKLLDGKPECLRFLRTLKKVKALEISGGPNTKDLSDFGNMLDLRSLSITGFPLLKDASEISRLEFLESLTLSNCPQVTNFSKHARNLPLKKIRLDHLTVAQVGSLVNLSGNGTLRHIHLGSVDNTGWNDRNTKSNQLFPGFSDMPNLVRLSILAQADNRFERFSNLPKLEFLRLRTNGTTLPKLEKVPCLKQIDLSHNPSLASLAGLEATPALEELTCWKCVKLQDVSALSNHLNLRKLNLMSTSLGQHTKKGKRLVALENLNSLIELELNNIPLEDDDLRSLSKLKNLKVLLVESNPGLTRVGGEWLKRQLPNCDVSFFVFDF